MPIFDFAGIQAVIFAGDPDAVRAIGADAGDEFKWAMEGKFAEGSWWKPCGRSSGVGRRGDRCRGGKCGGRERPCEEKNQNGGGEGGQADAWHEATGCRAMTRRGQQAGRLRARGMRRGYRAIISVGLLVR